MSPFEYVWHHLRTSNLVSRASWLPTEYITSLLDKDDIRLYTVSASSHDEMLQAGYRLV